MTEVRNQAACSRSVLVGAFALCFSFVLSCPHAVCQSNTNAPAKLTGTVITPKLGIKSGGTGYSDTFKLSPDGAYLAHLHQDNIQAGNSIHAAVRSTVEIRDARSSTVVTTFHTPLAEDEESDFDIRDSLQYCDSGKYLLVSPGRDRFYVIETKTYQQHAVIDLDFKTLHATSKLVRWLARASCAASGNVVAFSPADGEHSVVRVFNLDTGDEIQETNRLFHPTGITDVDVSSSAKYVMIPDRLSYVIFNMQTGAVASRIPPNFANAPFGSYPGPVRFVGDSMLSEVWSTNIPISDGRQSLYLWDIKAGTRAQVIDKLDPKARDVSIAGLSADGRTILAYTRKTSHDEERVKGASFSLWDRESGRLIAQSQSLKVIHYHCPLGITSFGCAPGDDSPWLTLSQSGNAVAVWYASGGQPVTVYTLPPTTPTH